MASAPRRNRLWERRTARDPRIELARAANKDSEEIRNLRQVVSNLDDYKQVGDLTVPFAFNKYTLTWTARTSTT